MSLFVLSGILLPSILVAQQVRINVTEDPNELRENIAELSDEIQQIEGEIAAYKQDLAKIGEEKKTLQSTIRIIDTERKKLLADVTLTDKEITKTELTLDEIRTGIDVAGEHIDLHHRAIAKNFRQINQSDDTALVEIMLGDEKLSDIFSELNNIQSLHGTIQDRIFELRRLRAELNQRRGLFQDEREQLEELKGQILDQKKLVEKQKREKDTLLRETQMQESSFQSLIAEREVLRKAFEKELYEYEAQLQFILDPTRLPAKGSAPLSWPMDDVVVTQLFRARTGPHAAAANGHSGVDFRGDGDPVYAMADGIVVGVGDTDEVCRGVSFGKWILVKFDNNLAATYGHLSIISAHEGQRVERGQLLGYSGSSGRVTGPHLHISLYAGIAADGSTPVEVKGKESVSCRGKILVQPRAPLGAYLDLIDYLPPITEPMVKSTILGEFRRRYR